MKSDHANRSMLDLPTPVEDERPRPRALPIYQVPNPCEESWDGMRVVGSGRRFCGLCAKDVHDLTHLSAEEMDAWVEAWRAERGDEAACVRFYARADGTFVEGDCGPWRERVARQARRAALWGAARLAAATATILAFIGISAKFGVVDGCATMTAGEMVYEPAPDPPDIIGGAMAVQHVPEPGDMLETPRPDAPEAHPSDPRRPDEIHEALGRAPRVD
ncbi:MAG: hypothetical protein AAF411_10770 [Myxococcota bacterium]